MVGVPMLKATDMLNLSKFEELERKYADNCDKSITINRRTPQPIAKCFDKLLFQEHGFQVSESILMSMEAKDFSKLFSAPQQRVKIRSR